MASIVAGDSALPEVARVPAFAGAFAGVYWLTLRAELKLKAHDDVPNKKNLNTARVTFHGGRPSGVGRRFACSERYLT